MPTTIDCLPICRADPARSIGLAIRRYRRQDEACLTVGGQTLTDQTITIRDRDTLEQWRVKIDDVVEEIAKRVS